MVGRSQKRPDIVFITVDCWRHDAIAQMPILKSRVNSSDFQVTEQICAAAATNGAISSLLAGSYYPRVYNSKGKVKDSVGSLPDILGQEGYRTGAFIGGNPYISKWSDRFDHFWNPIPEVDSFTSNILTKFQKGWQLARLKTEISADSVTNRASTWMDETRGPTFTWLHLMEPHSPYHPGLEKGFKLGLWDVYQTLIRLQQDDSRKFEDLGPDTVETLHSLYWACVEQLDKRLENVFDIVPDGATVILTADHGEELYHGVLRHARLYDECIQVPFITRSTLPNQVNFGTQIRQIDVAPTVLKGLGVSIPDYWDGRPTARKPRPAFTINPSPQLNSVFAGYRTDKRKVIKTLDSHNLREKRTEQYDLVNDSFEEEPLEGENKSKSLERKLSKFIKREDIYEGLVQDKSGVPIHFNHQLDALGYKT